MGDTTSTTKKGYNSPIHEFFESGRFECTIEDGEDSVTGYGTTAEEAEENAKEKWENIEDE